MISKPELERVCGAFTDLLKAKGVAHVLEYLSAIEAGKIPMPPGMAMSQAEFIDCGRTGCATYVKKYSDPKLN